MNKKSKGTAHGELPGKVRQDLHRTVGDVVTYSASLVSQGNHKFYTLTVPSKVLAMSSRAVKRDEDPVSGFQRRLDKRRAQEIADYVDSGGVIPNSIVLSAQQDANFSYSHSRRSVTFTIAPGAFFILDGQHRAYGFHLANKTVNRVPIVVFEGLTLAQECQLFMDINTKQRPVPNELLLDIKKLAEHEDDEERFNGEVFDLFRNSQGSPLAGLLSPAAKAPGKLTRVTFYAAKPKKRMTR
jgi:DGQHR domain-containing protein